MNDKLVAYHEAGHALVGHAAGLAVGPVSIAPTKSWRGVARVGAGFTSAEIDFDPRLPLPLIPAEQRAKLETSILVDLAGPAGEALAPRDDRPCDGYERLPLLERIASPDFALTEEEARYLRSGDERESSLSDLERAFELAEVLCGPRALSLVRLLAAEVDAMLRRSVTRRRLDQVAAALLQKKTLSACALQAVLASA